MYRSAFFIIFDESNIKIRVDNLYLLHAKVLEVVSLIKEEFSILSRYLIKDKDDLINMREELVSANKIDSRFEDMKTFCIIIFRRIDLF